MKKIIIIAALLATSVTSVSALGVEDLTCEQKKEHMADIMKDYEYFVSEAEKARFRGEMTHQEMDDSIKNQFIDIIEVQKYLQKDYIDAGCKNKSTTTK